MKRKLLALLLSGFAIILLMGAGVEESSEAPVENAADSTQTEGQPAPVEKPDDLIQTETGDSEPESGPDSEASQPEPQEGGDESANEEEPAPEPEITVDQLLTVNGQPAPLEIGKFYAENATFVSLVEMSQLLAPEVQAAWNEAQDTVTLTAPGLELTAQAGKQYIVANERYLYSPVALQIVEGRMTVPLKALAKAFGAEIGWDAETGAVQITTGESPIQHGSEFYNEDDLFWMSRVIYAESGNQCLEGKMAVGNVVLNRVGNPIFPDSILDVIAQKNQFSTYRSGALAKRTPNESSIIAAKLVLDGGVVEEVANALYFDCSTRSWASTHRNCIAVIEDHKFYD